MARPRSFDETAVVDAAAACFRRFGYAATSVDDLVSATGLHRGSLYGAFGSKRGLFVAALGRGDATAQPTRPQPTRPRPTGPQTLDEQHLDLLLVAALELAPHDDGVRDAVTAACTRIAEHGDAAAVLGRRLLQRAGVTGPTGPPDGPDAPRTTTRRT